MSETLYFEDLTVGRTFDSASRAVSDAMIRAFAELSGDRHPLHLDDDFARKTPFGERIAHGLLGLSVASGLLDDLAVIRMSIVAFAGLEWKFRGPVRIGDSVRFHMKVARARGAGAAQGLVVFESRLVNQREETVQEGTWSLIVRKRA